MTGPKILTSSVYLKTEDGKTVELRGPRFNKLKKEITAGRGGPEVTALIMAGNVSFLADDGQCYGLEEITADTFKPE